MAFSIEDQLTADMDIFIPIENALNKIIRSEKSISIVGEIIYPFLDNRIDVCAIHVASAGGILPERLMELDNILNGNASKFRAARQQFECKINPNLNEIKRFKSAYHRELYIEDFVDKARKGFVSFDKTDINNPGDKSFHLVAYPIWGKNQFYAVQNLGFEKISFDGIILNNIFNNPDLFKEFELFKGI